MRKIEDIRPPKKKNIEPLELKESKVLPGDQLEEDAETSTDFFYYPEAEQPKIVKPNTSLAKSFILFFVVLVLLSALFVYSLVRAQQKIAMNVGSVQSNFNDLSDAISDKDLISIGSTIGDVDQKTSMALLDLQSVGQNINVFDLITPKNKISKTTKLANSVQAAHVLTFAYKNLINFDQNNGSTPIGDWIAKTNQILGEFQNQNNQMKNKILFSSFICDLSNHQLEFLLDDFTSEEKISIEHIQKLSNISSDFFHYFKSVPENISDLFGMESQKSYLILFQNNAEIRPGGGFIGSFARVDFDKGNLKSLDFEKNIYTLDKSYIASGAAPSPPDEYKDFISQWTMRDSNVFADFEESAKKVSWFYKEESGKDVDGVIAIDTTLFRQLLTIAGPIEMPEYQMTVTSDNFLSDVQYQVEVGYFENKDNWSENQPKKILSDMLPMFMEKLFSNKEKNNDIISTLIRAFEEKHLLVYLENSKLQDLVVGINFAGKVKGNSGDYLMVSDANIGGLKSSINIDQKYTHNIKIEENGDVVEQLLINRRHRGSYEWPDGINKNYLKVFLPLSSEIEKVDISSDEEQSVKTDQDDLDYVKDVEFGKTTVSFWQNTNPGSETQTTLDYMRYSGVSTKQNSFDYNISIQKQPGIDSFGYSLSLVYPVGWEPINVENYDKDNRKILLNYTIKKDTSFRIKFVRSGTQ